MFSQDLEKKITVITRNQPLGEVINKIGDEGNIFFSYNPQSLPLDIKVTVKAKNKSIREVLDLVLKKNGITYFITENQVVLKMSRMEGTDKPGEKSLLQGKHTISGYLKDKATGEVLIGVNIYIRDLHLGTTTNGYGFYSLTLPANPYQLIFSYVGYKDVQMNIDLEKDKVGDCGDGGDKSSNQRNRNTGEE